MRGEFIGSISRSISRNNILLSITIKGRCGNFSNSSWEI
jgi:hypothetical protein